jgi:hypothetical protein
MLSNEDYQELIKIFNKARTEELYFLNQLISGVINDKISLVARQSGLIRVSEEGNEEKELEE